MLYFYGLFIEKGNLFASKKRPTIVFLDKTFFAKNSPFLMKTNDLHNKCNFSAPNRAL